MLYDVGKIAERKLCFLCQSIRRTAQLRNGSSSPQGAACATKLGICGLCIMVGWALSSHRPLLTGGASARGAKKRAAHILAYIQI